MSAILSRPQCDISSKLITQTTIPVWCWHITTPITACRRTMEPHQQTQFHTGYSIIKGSLFWMYKCAAEIGSLTFHMMTSSNGNIFRLTGHLCGEFIGHRWIPRTKASDAELWCFLWSTLRIKRRVDNREAGYLRHHSAHYDFIVMKSSLLSFIWSDIAIWTLK